MKVLIPMHTAKGLALFHAQVSFRKLSSEMNIVLKSDIKAEKQKYGDGNFKYIPICFLSCPK